MITWEFIKLPNLARASPLSNVDNLFDTIISYLKFFIINRTNLQTKHKMLTRPHIDQ